MNMNLSKIESGPDLTPEEYVNQREVYWSASAARYEQVRYMPCPHALRALAKLERTAGFDVLATPLSLALKERAETGIGAEVTDVPAGSGEGKMLRDTRTGQFRGAYRKPASKRKTI